MYGRYFSSASITLPNATVVPLGLITLEDIGAGVAELTRIAKKGMKGAMIWAEAPGDRPYSHPDYDPFGPRGTGPQYAAVIAYPDRPRRHRDRFLRLGSLAEGLHASP